MIGREYQSEVDLLISAGADGKIQSWQTTPEIIKRKAFMSERRIEAMAVMSATSNAQENNILLAYAGPMKQGVNHDIDIMTMNV